MTGPPPRLACPPGRGSEHADDKHNTNPVVAAEVHQLFRRLVILPGSVLVDVSVMHVETWAAMTRDLGWQRAEHPFLQIRISVARVTAEDAAQAAGLTRLAALVSTELADAVGEAVRLCQFKEP